ncbi:amidase family protein [Nocardioides sp. R1-1]|uniref:amidase family protein n=1 Tax=Nocardioides sp. R1-1 TaxID=3383502 RepID=UPI0038CF3A6F
MVDDLTRARARELVEGQQRGDFSAREVLAAHLDRIDRVNPVVNALVTIDREGAEAAAAAADAETARRRAEGRPLRPLHGVPIAFKDTHATAGMRTTYGSPLHREHVPAADDEVVRRIADAGAVRVGKTNVPEFAAGSHTFNEVFGATHNPYAVGRTAGGSSGGAAAALAAGFQPVADGSDMGGSLRNPASMCNVVGLRPTPGRIADPATGMAFTPLAVSGPMGRTVDDTALLLGVMAGPHRDDPLSDHGGDLAAELAGGVDPVDLRGLRVAWAPTLGERVTVERQVLDVLEPAVKVFAGLGADVEEACLDLDGSDDAFRTLRAAEFDLLWGELLDERPADLKPDLAWNIREGRRLSGRDVMRAFAEVTRLHRAAHTFFDEYDVLLAPVSQVAPFPVEIPWPTDIEGSVQHTYLDWMAASYLLTPLGVPAISVPAGFTPDGLPVGLQIVTRARTESTLLGIAAAFEAATGHGRCAPRLPEVLS